MLLHLWQAMLSVCDELLFGVLKCVACGKIAELRSRLWSLNAKGHLPLPNGVPQSELFNVSVPQSLHQKNGRTMSV